MKRTFIQKSITLAALVTSVSAMAFGFTWWWKSPNNSFEIDITKSGQIVSHVGETARLTGEIDWFYAHGKSRRTAPNGILDQTETHFYFPDLAHEVTSQVALNKRTLTFGYTTPALEAGTSPSFIVVVGKLSPRIGQLQALSAKLQRRIAAIEAILNNYRHQNPRWKREETEELNDLIATLTRVNQKLAEALAQKTEVITKREFPIQVDNAAAALTRSQTLIGGMSLDLSFDRGVLIQGEKTQGHVLLSNLRDRLPSDTPYEVVCRKGDQWTIEYYWNGQLLSRKNQKFDPGALVAFDFDTGAVDPSKPNLAEVYLYKRSGAREARTAKLCS